MAFDAMLRSSFCGRGHLTTAHSTPLKSPPGRHAPQLVSQRKDLMEYCSVCNDPLTWSFSLSTLLCTAHAHDTRVLMVVLPNLLSDPTKMFYEHLFGNATAVQRMASELTAMVSATGIDGIEFDLEEMTHEMRLQPDNKFDYGEHHVAAMTQVSQTMKAAQPHATVAITIEAIDVTPPLTNCDQWSSVCTYARLYPVARLSKAVDQVFIMAYDMWEAGQQCGGPNSPLPAVKKSVQSFVDAGAAPSKLILGIPFYGFEYKCNSSLTRSSSSAPCKAPGLSHGRRSHFGRKCQQ